MLMSSMISLIDSSLLDSSSWIFNRPHKINKAKFKNLSPNPFQWSLHISVNVIFRLRAVQDINPGGIFDLTFSLIAIPHPLVNPVTMHPDPASFSPFLSL